MVIFHSYVSLPEGNCPIFSPFRRYTLGTKCLNTPSTSSLYSQATCPVTTSNLACRKLIMYTWTESFFSSCKVRNEERGELPEAKQQYGRCWSWICVKVVNCELWTAFHFLSTPVWLKAIFSHFWIPKGTHLSSHLWHRSMRFRVPLNAPITVLMGYIK